MVLLEFRANPDITTKGESYRRKAITAREIGEYHWDERVRALFVSDAAVL
jgi:hypothetical protein